jgi:hypothetical protein
MWELLGLCLTPVSVGMGAVWRIGLEEFKHFINRAGVLDADSEDVYEILQEMLRVWETNKEFAAIEQKDITLLHMISDGN